MPDFGPYSQDVLTRIYNVHWAGGVFIAMNADGNIYYLKLNGNEDGKLAWEDLGTLGLTTGNNPYPAGCAYAMTGTKNADGSITNKQPVFVIVAGYGSSTSPGVIMASKDGKNWSRVFTFANDDSGTSQGASVWAVVWDESKNMFYAGGHMSNSFADRDTDISWMSETDLLFSSSDGFQWSEAGRHVTRVDSSGGEFPDWPEYTTGLLDPHCSKRYVDEHNNGISDGYYGYDKEKKVMIAANDIAHMDYFFGRVQWAQGAGIAVTFFGEPDPAAYPTDTGLSLVTTVAFAGGTWIAAGGNPDPSGGNQPPSGGGKSEAAILATDEKGEPAWKRLNPPGTNIIIAMCGGSLF